MKTRHAAYLISLLLIVLILLTPLGNAFTHFSNRSHTIPQQSTPLSEKHNYHPYYKTKHILQHQIRNHWYHQRATDENSTLISDTDNDRVIEINDNGEILWQKSSLNSPFDSERLDNNNTLICETYQDRVIEINSEGEIIWQKTRLNKPYDAERLENGNTLICNRNNQSVIEITSEGVEVWNITDLGWPADAERLENGNTLIADTYNDQIIEVDSSKTTVWSHTGLNRPYDAERLENGNTLIADTYNNKIIEVDSSGNEVWVYTNLNRPYDCERLQNGNTLITDRDNHRIIEVTAEKEIIWDTSNIGVSLLFPTDAEYISHNRKPIADTNGPYLGYTDTPITLNGSQSYDPDGDIILYEWDFDGDGTYDWDSPITGIVNHTYNIPGIYTAILRVTDSDDATDTNSTSVTIYQSGMTHDVLISDSDNDRVVYVENNKNEWWSQLFNTPFDAKWLHHGKMLISETYQNRVIIINFTGDILWEQTGLNHPYDAEEMNNSNILITDRNNERIIEVKRTTQNIIWTSEDYPDELNLSFPSDAEELPFNELLITDTYHDRVIIFNKTTESITWNSDDYSFELSRPTDAELLTNNNILITDQANNRIIEVNTTTNSITWNTDDFGMIFDHPFDAERTSVNTTLIVDRDNHRVLELYKNGSIKWMYTALHYPTNIEPVPRNYLNILINGSGNVTKNRNLINYAFNETVTLTAIPADNETLFIKWTGDLNSTDNPINITMNTSKNVTAHFNQKGYVLNITTVGNGTVQKDPDQETYLYNTTVTLTALPAPGWVFSHWTGDDINGSTENPETITMNESKNITAQISRHTLILDGYCMYNDTKPVTNLTVTIHNLNTSMRWNATTEGDYYHLILSIPADVTTNHTLRYIAKDNTTWINVTDSTVTQNEIDTQHKQTNLTLNEYYLDLVDFPMYLAEDNHPRYNESQLCGAAAAQMNLNYMWWNQTQHDACPLTYDNQTQLYEQGQQNNSNTTLPYLDAHGMLSLLQDKKPAPSKEYGYHFQISHNTSLTGTLADICYWINYKAGIKPGHPLHVPGAVPTYGDYTNWMSIRGIHTSEDPEEALNYNVYGLWVNDPHPTGIGENTYKTAQEWNQTYFYPITVTDDPYYGEYIAVVEPPEHVQPHAFLHPSSPRYTFKKDPNVPLRLTSESHTIQAVSDSRIIKAAIEGVSEQLLPYSPQLEHILDTSYPARPLYVSNLHNPKHNYYIIPFKHTPTSFIPRTPHQQPQQKTRFAILINAADGHFKEASWVETPVSYLTLTQHDALQITFDTLESMGYTPDEISSRSITITRIYRQNSPYYPEWQIQLPTLNLTFYVDQEGNITTI